MARHGLAEVLTGAIVLVVAIGFLAFAVAHSGRSASGGGYDLLARFDHIDGLSIGGEVRIAGVKVGSVTDEELDPKTFSAIVTLTIRNGIQLSKDTGAAIVSESLLGGKYVSLSPGGDETNLKPGQTIMATQSSVSLEELLGKFIFSVTSLNSSKAADGGNSSQSGSASPGGEKAAGEKAAGEKAAGEKAAGEKAAGEKAGGGLAPLPK